MSSRSLHSDHVFFLFMSFYNLMLNISVSLSHIVPTHVLDNFPTPFKIVLTYTSTSGVNAFECCYMPGILNRTFGNRTQSNSIHGLSSIEFGNRTKSNIELCVRNRTQSNSIHWIVLDWVRPPNSIEHNPIN